MRREVRYAGKTSWCKAPNRDLINAVSLVAEIGELSWFEHPRKLMGYLGLVPSEHSGGEKVRGGSIT